jgi:hypothetical protein
MTEEDVKAAAGLLSSRRQTQDDIARVEKFKARGLFKLFGEKADGKDDYVMFYPDATEGEAIRSLLLDMLHARAVQAELALEALGVKVA